ncbi:MAG: lipoate--protein ligase family protein [Candidatus Margulisiibacteriota bacterium]
MHFFKYSYNTPIENLAVDEYLLAQVNSGQFQAGICRVWESPIHFVVLGLSKKITDDVNNDACRKDGVPILKRCSGGGTVLQGPGCFNYSFILPISYASELESLTMTTRYILNIVKNTLSSSIKNIELKGISDLTINDIKFSGNAQRRLKNAILFHGTILYDFNLKLITQYLKEPPVQPDYRKQRLHASFIQNLNVNQQTLFDLFHRLSTKDTILNSMTIPKDYLLKYSHL